MPLFFTILSLPVSEIDETHIEREQPPSYREDYQDNGIKHAQDESLRRWDEDKFGRDTGRGRRRRCRHIGRNADGRWISHLIMEDCARLGVSVRYRVHRYVSGRQTHSERVVIRNTVGESNFDVGEHETPVAEAKRTTIEVLKCAYVVHRKEEIASSDSIEDEGDMTRGVRCGLHDNDFKRALILIQGKHLSQHRIRVSMIVSVNQIVKFRDEGLYVGVEACLRRKAVTGCGSNWNILNGQEKDKGNGHRDLKSSQSLSGSPKTVGFKPATGIAHRDDFGSATVNSPEP